MFIFYLLAFESCKYCLSKHLWKQIRRTLLPSETCGSYNQFHRLNDWGRGVAICPPCGFYKNLSWKFIFCDFWYYHRSHLSWKFHWNSSIRSEDTKFSPSILTIFINFSDFLTSAYNKWYQHFFFNFNLL